MTSAPSCRTALPLLLLEPATQSDVSRPRCNGQHVRPVNDPPALDTGEPKHESEQRAIAIERTERDAADAL